MSNKIIPHELTCTIGQRREWVTPCWPQSAVCHISVSHYVLRAVFACAACKPTIRQRREWITSCWPQSAVCHISVSHYVLRAVFACAACKPAPTTNFKCRELFHNYYSVFKTKFSCAIQRIGTTANKLYLQKHFCNV
jgi:hypothetical protein